ncbi:MAG: sensor domain-containing diguanylate cyclase [Thermomicrobiales bacterium]
MAAHSIASVARSPATTAPTMAVSGTTATAPSAAAWSGASYPRAATRRRPAAGWTGQLGVGHRVGRDALVRRRFPDFGFEPGWFRSTFDLFLSTIHSRDRERSSKAISMTIEHGAPLPARFTINRPDGGERIVNVQGEVIRDNRGAPIGMRGTMLDVTVRKELEAQLARQALLDPLTGLPNRRSLSKRLDDAGTLSRRKLRDCVALHRPRQFQGNQRPVGHDAGDDVLIQVAERLESCLREQDMAVRLGGDEFVVLLDGVSDIDTVIQIADRLLEAIREPIETERSTSPSSLTASIGIVISNAGTQDAEELLHVSDAAMYSAKAQGKARWIARSPLQHG